MKKLRVLFPLCGSMADENISLDTVTDSDSSSDVVVKPVRKRRARVSAVAEDVGDYVDSDGVIVQRIRDGDWLAVIKEVGSTKYNELRLLALK